MAELRHVSQIVGPGIAQRLAALSEHDRVNLALELVDGVDLDGYEWEGDPRCRESVKPKTAWSFE